MSELTQEEKRVRIAEACGWKHVGIREAGSFGAGSPYGFKPNAAVIYPQFTGFMAEVPDYFNDLNAMHEAEAILSFDQMHITFIGLLQGIAQRDWINGDKSAKQTAVHATAAQRAEAFGKTLKLW